MIGHETNTGDTFLSSLSVFLNFHPIFFLRIYVIFRRLDAASEPRYAFFSSPVLVKRISIEKV